jgi:hypothetical protein
MERLDSRQMLASNNLFYMDPAVTAEDLGLAANQEEQVAAAAAASASATADASTLVATDQIYSVNIEDRLLANFDMGGTPILIPECRKLAFGLCSKGWEAVLRDDFQPVVNAGIRRMLVLMPFGQRSWVLNSSGQLVAAPGQIHFQFDAYLDADAEVPNRNATRDFVSAWQNFFATNRANGVNLDAIVYIGSPRHDPDQTALLNNSAAWWDRVYDIILPLLRAGFRSIGFDASAVVVPEISSGVPNPEFVMHQVLRYPELRDPVRDARLINVVGNERVEVYLEAVPIRASGRTDFPLTVIDSHFMDQDPTLPGTTNDIFFEHDQFTGEVIRIVTHSQWQQDPPAPGEPLPGILAVENILFEGHSVSTAPAFLTRPQNNGGADTLEEFADLLFVGVSPSIPTVVDLDPDDRHPESAEYDFLIDPDHGQLIQNPWHEDAFTYSPDPGYVGEDFFTYVVRDPVTGEIDTGRVDFYVGVPAPVAGDPSRDSGRRNGGRRSRGD